MSLMSINNFSASLLNGAKFTGPILNAWLELKTNGWPWPYRVLGPPDGKFPDPVPHGVARADNASGVVKAIWMDCILFRLNFAPHDVTNCVMLHPNGGLYLGAEPELPEGLRVVY